jgi:hypothetical protein
VQTSVITTIASLFLCLTTIAAAADDSAVIYRETFNIPDPAQGDPSGLSGSAVAAALGWKGFRNGGSYNNPCSTVPLGETCLQAFSPGSTQLPSIGNLPVFSGSGNAFWSPQVIGVTIYTEEKPIPVELVRQGVITFETRHNQNTSLNRLALRMGDTWYISDRNYFHTAGPSTWQTDTFDELDTALFGTTPVDTSCTTPPCGPFKPGLFNQTLPETGTVDAIGIFVDGTGANHRFDNYTVSVGLEAFPNQGQCISTLIELNCADAAGAARKACNKQQQGICKSFF